MSHPLPQGFHPLVEGWFRETFDGPTAPQSPGWEAIAAGGDTLIAAPTGSGKTLAAFLWAINGLVEAASSGRLADETSVVYISPLKALGNDIQKNLQIPLAAIRELAASSGTELPEIRVAVRTGDTSTAERNLMIRKPPHILITTPESFYILLTAERSRQFLRTARTVIVDEIHAVAGDKRGAHLALSLERLDLLAGTQLQRIGLSATQKPIEEIAQLLIGSGRRDSQKMEAEAGGRLEVPVSRVSIVDVGHQREWDLKVEVPSLPLGPISTHEIWAETYDRIVQLSKDHRTTLVFVSTRRLVERVSHQLTQRLGEGKVAAHHGSLSRKIRLEAEQGLKSGQIPIVVATASLELGIDIGHVDLVCHLGAPRALATLLQRVGRSGHWLGAIPKGVIFPLTRDDLVQSAAAIWAATSGELDRVVIPENALDILAQQIVAIAASGEIEEEALFALVRRAFNYRRLPREEFDQVIEMLSEGVASRRGRRSAHLLRDQVHGVLKGRRGARLAAITSGGAIPDTADYDVIAEPDETLVGKVNEDFAIESMAGDIFLLGNTSWKIRRVEAGRVRVEDARGLPPTIPFWVGEAPSRTPELSSAVSELRKEVASRIPDRGSAVDWLRANCGVDEAGAEQIADYIAETIAGLGCVPTTDVVVAERFFDESGGMQLVVHAPFGGRINRAWGLALRKRFCVTFDFELQAAATDDGIVLSLGEQHSFPLESAFNFVRTPTLQETLVQAVLPAPMFTNRWRWNATRSLALLRHSGGRRVPMPIQRMRAEDLLSAVFPEQVACQENTVGPIIPPDHPLVNETIANCLHEAMDLDGLAEVIGKIESGEIKTVAVETPAPSVMSHEILNANPYAFLDDAPLEERRARAVSLRRTDPGLAEGIGALEQAAIEEVRAQARPDVRDADELHDHLLSVGVLPAEELGDWVELANQLMVSNRATVALWNSTHGARRGYVAAERLDQARAAISGVRFVPEIPTPSRLKDWVGSREDAVRSIVQGWMQCLGPITSIQLSQLTGLEENDIEVALLALEGSGEVLRGHFTPGTSELEWCERRLLSRIHRLTLGRLRAEIEPVSPAQYLKFLLRWQHVQPGTQLHGREGVIQVVGQLQGLELPAPSWEEKILPARVARYDPADLEYLCLSGTVAWGRLLPSQESSEPPLDDSEAPRAKRRSGPARNTPIAFVMREDLPLFASRRIQEDTMNGLSTAAQEVLEYLNERGASFLTDIVKGTGRLAAEVEEALWELVSGGWLSGDGIAGLRHLLRGAKRSHRRHEQPRLRALPGARARTRPLPVGRWALWGPDLGPTKQEERNEGIAAQLLRRYGVVFRDVLARERAAPSWRVLLGIYRRWEAQGRVRGGRFVGGFVGEQFALPEAVESLRTVRKSGESTETVILSAADPLNLIGIVLPGARVSPFSGLSIAYVNGAVAEVELLGTLRTKLWKPAQDQA